MGYSGARGGLDAILAAEELVRTARDTDDSPALTTAQITGRMRLAVDRVMGEGSLYDEATAADALRQAEGDVIEATHLVRAHQSTLPRLATSEPVDPDEMTVLRRIVPAWRTPDGPQLLGRTSDYTGRMLVREGTNIVTVPSEADPSVERTEAERHPRRFSDLLRDMNLMVDSRPEDGSDPEPFDISRHLPVPPAPRSGGARLDGASRDRCARGHLVPLGPRHRREHPRNDPRRGPARAYPGRIRHPHTGNPFVMGEIRASECEAIEDLNGPDEDRGRFDVGYGLCFGHNERKAIAMANLDIACRRFGDSTGLEQTLLLTTDGLDSCGFLEHLKLPHYVTFRSMIDRKLAVQAGEDDAPARTAEPLGGIC